MWPWRCKAAAVTAAPAVTADAVLERWKREAGADPYRAAIDLGVAEVLDSFPYAIAVTDTQGAADWVAPNIRLAGNVLVAWEPAFPGVSLADPPGVNAYDRKLAVVRRLSRWIVPVSDTVWLIGTEHDIAAVHQQVGDALGVMSRSLTVVDLFSGRAIGWDAKRGLMTQIEPARPAPE